MAPLRRSKNLNKLSFKENKRSIVKGAGNGVAKHKRKESNILGCEWSKDELERFYLAYRAHGKNWKKVAAKVPTRSVEMVEALFELNKAYLSLPEGIGSVVGLIAMMTDYYKSLDSDGNETESENIEESKTSHLTQKHYRGKSRSKISKSPVVSPHMLRSHPIASKHECLSSLKNMCSNGSETRIVGRRTPRVPISPPYSKGDTGKHLSSSKRDANSREDINTEEATQGASVSTKAIKEESPPQVPNRRTEHMRLWSVRGWGNIHAESENVRSKHNDALKVDRWRGSSGIRKTRIADSIRDSEDIDEVRRKRKQLHTSNLDDTSFDHLETCKMDSKRRKQLLSEDESSALDALTILAGPFPEMEPTILEDGPKEDENNNIAGEENLENAGCNHEEKKGLQQSSIKKKKRKGKNLPSKISEDDYLSDSPLSQEMKTEASKKSIEKGRLENRTFSFLKQSQSVKPESVSSKEDSHAEGDHVSTLDKAQDPIVHQVKIPTKVVSRRKMRKMMVHNRTKSPESIGNAQRSDQSASLHDRPQSLKEGLFHCLSSQAVQRWCAFEWFYSSVDYPWFANREFVAYLNHVNLAHIPKLTRVEWGVIRSSLGRARRFSHNFLMEEKKKLEEYREFVRGHYAQLRSGTVKAIPSDLVRPLRVGQCVIARHPKIRGIFNGKVLTVEHNKCRVQFDRVELGVQLVEDIDCMDTNLLDNIPEAFRLENIAVGKDQKKFNESLHAKIAAHIRCSPNAHLESTNGSPAVFSLPHPPNSILKNEKGETSQEKASTSIHDTAQAVRQLERCSLEQIHSRESDIRVILELSCALEKKEVLVSELRFMNTEYVNNRNVMDSEIFKKYYASVLLMLKETNDQVSSAVMRMRERNTYEEKSSLQWIRPPVIKPHIPNQETGSNVIEVVRNSILKAQNLVNAAGQVMSSLKQGEDAYVKIGEVLKLSDDTNPSQDTPSDNNELSKVEIPSSLISSCVATLLMIQSCADKQYPPGEAAEILEYAVTSLEPGCPQNVPIYRELQMCMGMVKNQILALIPTT
ncbi:hypothetical protein ACHQM5_015086 [Ranunculus cassubicifolius]